jgi:hypothetical protein
MNGGDIPSFYSVEYSSNQAIWYEINTGGTYALLITHWPGTILTNKAYYRVRPRNGVGFSSAYSAVLEVTIGTNNFTANACDINPTNMTICWWETTYSWGSAALPTFYQVEWLNPTAYGNSCSNVPNSVINDETNPSLLSNSSSWVIVSPTSGTKFLSF